jgi:hypothetical protein
VKSVVLCVSIFALLSVAEAQTVRGRIGGTVTDASKKPVAGAAVRVVDEATNRERKAASDTAGEFAVSELAPGAYRVEVERDGYRKSVQSLTLLLNQEAWLDVALLAGQINESVTVTAARGLLRTDSAAVGGVVENRQITGLPLDGRNFHDLSLLLPGVAPAAQGSAASIRGDFAMNVNGAREDSNHFLLDGVFNGDPKLNTVAVTPPVDAVREFEVLTSSYDASFGRNPGGQVSVVLKSGSNQAHGAVYEFVRNAAWDTTNYFAPASEPKPQYQRNQFGATLGGPVVRNRTFFFMDYEGRRVREGVTKLSNVPTALERTGDFSRSQALAIDLFTQSPFPGNKIPRERLHPVGAAIASLYPLPNRADPRQNFVSSPSARDREDHFDVKVDHMLTRSDDLSVRYSFADRDFFEAFSGPTFASVPGFGTSIPRRAHNFMLSETHVFTPALLNEVRAAFNRVASGTAQQNQGNDLNRAVGLPELSSKPRDFGLSFITLTGYSPLGDEYNNPQHSASNVYQVIDQATYARGRHLLKFGGEARLLRQNAFRDVQSRGFLNFIGFTGNSLAEMLQGFPSVTGGATLDNHQHLRTRSYNGFLHDTWRALPGLTVSMGLRYEYNAPPFDAENRANTFDLARGKLVPVGVNGVPRAGFDRTCSNVGPRVGLAWMPGDRKTVIRGGYGIYFDQPALATGEGLYFNAPYFNLRYYYSLDNFPVTLSDPFPKAFPYPTPYSALAFQKNLGTPYSQHWNLNVQRELGKSRTVEVGYVASKGTKLLAGRDINQPRPSPKPQNLRPNPLFDDITILESRANSTYHSLQARFAQRLAAGLSALASYTWSKSIDDASNFFSSAGDPNYPQDSYDLRAERGRSNFDLRHRFSVSYSYDLPLGKGRLRGGWQTFGIWSFQSGRPFTVALLPDLDNSNTGRSNLGFGANDRPNVAGNPALANPAAERWFDTGAFRMPAYGTFGNSGRNILGGPSYGNIAVSLVKNTRITERANVQFRAEAFNLLNRTNLDLPDIFLGSPTFGRISSADSPRRVQLGLKVLF